MQLQSDLTYEEKPIRVLEEMESVTRSKIIKFYKVVWNNHSEKMLRGKEKIIYKKFIPSFSKNGRSCKSRDEIFFKGEGL